MKRRNTSDVNDEKNERILSVTLSVFIISVYVAIFVKLIFF